MEIRLNVEEYGTIVIRPVNGYRPENIYVGIIDEDSDGDRELMVLTPAELQELVEALALIKDKVMDKYFNSVTQKDLLGDLGIDRG